MARQFPIVHVTLEKIVGGGQTLATLPDGRKLFVWGGLPGEEVEVQITKKKSKLAEGVVTNVLTSSEDRQAPTDIESYLSTSPWQIMNFGAEQRYKAQLIDDAFELHNVILPEATTIYSDGKTTQYRNKVEFSWYSIADELSGTESLDLAFFRRGSKGKIPVTGSILLPEAITTLARSIRDFLQGRGVTARSLKTLLIRCDQNGNCVWQLYVKDLAIDFITEADAATFAAQGGEVIYSNPKSPASVITQRLLSVGNVVLEDKVLDVPFRYATEGFFQVNIPVYEQALKDMQQWIEPNKKVVDLYSGVGSIGLTIGGDDVTLVEINEHAVREMKRNISEQGIRATPVLAASETALEYIEHDKTIIVDPPRAGLHDAVVERLLEVKPQRIIYLSCNPTTQARDVEKLLTGYTIRHAQGYNFFPQTPHIEHLVVLDTIT